MVCCGRVSWLPCHNTPQPCLHHCSYSVSISGQVWAPHSSLPPDPAPAAPEVTTVPAPPPPTPHTTTQSYSTQVSPHTNIYHSQFTLVTPVCCGRNLTGQVRGGRLVILLFLPTTCRSSPPRARPARHRRSGKTRGQRRNIVEYVACTQYSQ